MAVGDCFWHEKAVKVTRNAAEIISVDLCVAQQRASLDPIDLELFESNYSSHFVSLRIEEFSN